MNRAPSEGICQLTDPWTDSGGAPRAGDQDAACCSALVPRENDVDGEGGNFKLHPMGSLRSDVAERNNAGSDCLTDTPVSVR